MPRTAKRPATRVLALRMARLHAEGMKINAIGGTVYAFKPGHKMHGKALATNTEALACRDWLGQNGVSMRRTDAGGNPTWDFAVASPPCHPPKLRAKPK